MFKTLIVLLIFCVGEVHASPYPSLKKAASGKVLIGASLREWILGKDKEYESNLRHHFNIIWPEYYFKMAPIQPKRGVFDFKVADQFMDFAISAQQEVVGHTLVWFESLPKWFKEGEFSKKEITKIMKDHIEKTLEHFETKYPGRIRYWHVVNEAIDDYGQVRHSKWTQIGNSPTDYISMAFRMARKRAPKSKLFYNEYGIEYSGPKADRVYSLIKELVDSGVPIDGIGFQMHSSVRNPFNKSELEKQMKRYSDLGLEIHISEMEVRIYTKDGISKEEKKAQEKLYVDALKVCLKNEKCSAYIMCGSTDKYSWISENQTLFPGYGSAQIFDSKFEPKKPFFKILQALKQPLSAE